MADEFAMSVQLGMKLAQRIYYGKQRPPPPVVMERRKSETTNYVPTAPMAYAVITEPSIVDNPDIPSYQPYVHGKCEPPALIPLHMHGVTMEVDCYLDTAFITVSGTWRVHCITASKTCDCRIAVPMGEQVVEKSPEKIIILRSLGSGFGSLKATADNLPPETAEPKLHETSEIILEAASNFCGRMLDCCCCMCFIQFCSQLNDRCAVVLAQLCAALACFDCINFCCEVCDFCNA